MGKKIFTPEQIIAIDTRDKTLLVSAAAGSGKTATLTERIIRSITDENNPMSITDMLIVTFTNAAVNELRERISSALKEKLAELPDNQHLMRQINMLPTARISTIDSFCNEILKGNAEKFGISPKYRIADPLEASILSHSVLSFIIEAAYNGEINVSAEDFEELASCLTSVKNDSALEEVIIYLYEHSKSHKDGVSIYRRFARNYILSAENFDGNIYVRYAIDTAADMARHYSSIYKSFAEEYCIDEGTEKLKAALLATVVFLEEIAFSGSYEKTRRLLFSEIPSLSLPRVKTPVEETASSLHKDLKDKFKDLIEKFFIFSCDDWIKSFEKLSKLTENLATVIELFDKTYFEEKKKRSMLEYSDIERLTYLCLYDENGEITEFARSMKKEFSAVYIDEYQDVNSLQNKIFEAISDKTNRFMVGDIKQSIYGFRGAEPEVFAKMKESFPTERLESSDCMSVFMSKNFRCDDEIINFVNAIYDKMFELNGKSIGYVSEDRLTVGKEKDKFYEPRIPQIQLFTNEDVPEGDDDEEVEASTLAPDWTAKKISELINGSILNSGKTIQPKDIAIILRNDSGRSKVYRDSLKKYGIDAKIPDDKSFFLNSDVQLALCLLCAIDNPKRDIYLAGLMLSPLFDFTADELQKIKKEGAKSALWDSLAEFSKKNPNHEKSVKFIKTLNRYREIAEGTRVDALILKLYNETGILALAGKNGTKENLLLLYNYARKFEASSFEGLYNFINYLSAAIASGAKFATQAEESSNAVTILTAHKSKGLEFPIVFVADIGTPLVSSNEKRTKIVYSDDYGFAMRPRADGGLALVNSPIYNVIMAHNIDTRLEEELRVYYVALTRARERLYITGAIKSASKSKYIDEIYLKQLFASPYTLKEMKTFVDILHITPHKADIKWGMDLDSNTNVESDTVSNLISSHAVKEHYSELSPQTLKSRFSFKYPREHMSSLPKKMSISKLYPTVLDGNDDTPLISLDKNETNSIKFDTLPEFITLSKADISARKGIATHTFLQFCDFEALEKDRADEELSRLILEDFISEKNSKLVRMQEIELFCKSNLLKEIKKAKRIFREFRISVMLPAKLFTKDEAKQKAYDENEILLQGVIDCLFEDENGELHLVDYKTDRLTSDELSDKILAERTLSEKHSLQLSYYALAVKKIFGKYPKTVRVYSLPLGDTVNIKNIFS